MIELTYFGVIHAKKNSKQIIKNPHTGKPMIISNGKARDQEEAMAWAFKTQAPQAWLQYAVHPETTVEITIRIWEKDRRRRDLDNQATAILDALVQGNVIPDDSSQIVRKLTVEYMGVDKEQPRAEIKIQEMIP